jgi:hypothetical protein
MKERTFVGIFLALLGIVMLFGITRSTDVIFVAISIAFFVVCIGYAELCERL